MDELRLAACGGMRQLSRGGLEIGGVLFGTRRDNLIRLVNWRSLACEHAHGPALLLSEKDRDQLRSLLASAPTEIDLHGLMPIGWFVSHTRAEVSLLPSDQEIFQQFFPQHWQVALVLHPDRGGDCRAGFFVREKDGVLRTESSYREFTIEAISAPAPASSTAVAATGPALVRTNRPNNAPLIRRADTFWQPPQFPDSRKSGTASRWIWAIPGLLAIALAGAIIRDRIQTAPQPAIGLHLQEQGDAMTLMWDAHSPAVLGAFGGSLEIQDSQGNQHIELTREQLHHGSINYTRRSNDMEATLILRLTGGATAREVARYIGPVGPPKGSDPQLAELRRERDRLQTENAKLKEQARKNADLLRILQKRLQQEARQK